MGNRNILDIGGLIINLFALFITLYFQFKDPQTGILFFLLIIAIIIIYFIISYPINFFRSKIKQINSNSQLILEIKKDLNNLKDKFDLRSEIFDLKSKMNLLEDLITKKKKGQIDPRWILLLILLLLLFLFLKSKGYFG